MKNLLIITVMSILASSICNAAPKGGEEFLRGSKGVFDYQENTKSNVEFFSTNSGINALDIKNIAGGCIWPRGSRNQYIFGAGFWFAAKKEVEGTLKKLVSISYNPNSGRSWFVPGRIDDGNEVLENEMKKYRVYYSTDFDSETGKVKIPNDGPDWPLWVTDNSRKVQYGVYKHEYIDEPDERNLNQYPYGPMMHSDEHIFSTYKDTDLSLYEGGIAKRKSLGYPLTLQVEENTYTWESGEMKDVVIISYSITNYSDETYTECWFAPVIDCDIAIQPNTSFGAGNDRVNYYSDDNLELVYAWTNPDRGEGGNGFGYLGLSMLESPAVDNNGNIRHDKLIYEPQEQIGLSTFRNWSIENDILDDNDRYNYLSSEIIDGDTGAGDKRILMATGPFNLKPGETARLAIGISFAMPAKGGEADGSYEDITGFSEGKIKSQFQAVSTSLVGKQEKIQQEYYAAIYNSVSDYEALEKDAIYPNPANSMINIKYNNHTSGMVRISLINSSGIEVALLSDSYKPMGYHQENFFLGSVNSGMYMIKIETSANIYSQKLILQK